MIIAVAMWIDDRVESLPKPNRHHDIIRKFPISKHKHGEQGFIDDEHGFVMRRAALAIVVDQKQKTRFDKFCEPHHGLFSEDLW